jgi:RNA polymerase sigma factor (sigma-70 family)
MKLETLPETLNDAHLVEMGRDGNRDAFGQLVARYQSPVCALAYSACGNVSQSEDLAQEAFIIAWRKLRDLKEPAKFKAWLFGIARNLILHSYRQKTRNPLASAEPLDEAFTAPATASNPAGQAISREEEDILWRSLEQIPDNYREPLVLFYRENQSIESVAATLDLSEEATRQRLSRGRKLLQEHVTAFVEGALARTNPGHAFTLVVLAALPVTLATSAKAATLGIMAKGGAAAVKGTTLGSLLGIWLGPVLGILIGYWGYRENNKYVRTPRERQSRKRFTITIFAGALVFVGLLLSLLFVPRPFLHWDRHPMIIITLGLGLTLGWGVFVSVAAWRFARASAKLREEERQLHPELFRDRLFPATWPVVGEVLEYRSRTTLLGLPLVHCRFGHLPGEKTKPAVGWIAYGERAYGMLFASGGISVAPISMGGASFGILSFGGVGIGLVGFGGFAIGAVALGGAAVGWVASGGIALGWHAAMGGMAAAHEYALGGASLAHHINDSAAQAFFTRHRWLNFMQPGPSCFFWLGAFAPALFQMLAWRWLRQKMTGHVLLAGEKTKTAS